MKKILSLTLTVCMVLTMLTSLTLVASAETTVLFSDDMTTYTNDDRATIAAGITYDISGASLKGTNSSANRVSVVTLAATEESIIGFGRDQKLTFDFTDFALNDANQGNTFVAEFDIAYYADSDLVYLYDTKKAAQKTSDIHSFQIGDFKIAHNPGYGTGLTITGFGDVACDDDGTWDSYVVEYLYNDGWKYKVTRNGEVIIPETATTATSIEKLYFSGGAGSVNGCPSSDLVGAREVGAANFGTAFKNVEVYVTSDGTGSGSGTTPDPEEPGEDSGTVIPSGPKTTIFKDDMSSYNNDDRATFKSGISYDIAGASLTNSSDGGSRLTYTELPANGEKYMAFGRDSKLTFDFNDFALDDSNQENAFVAEFKMAYIVNANQVYLWDKSKSQEKTGNVLNFQIGDVKFAHKPGYGKGMAVTGYSGTLDAEDDGTWYTYKVEYFYDNGWNYRVTRNGEVIVPATSATATSVTNLYLSAGCSNLNGYLDSSMTSSAVETNASTFAVAFKDVEVYTVSAGEDEGGDSGSDTPTFTADYGLTFEGTDTITGVNVTVNEANSGTVKLFVAKYASTGRVDSVQIMSLTRAQKLEGGIVGLATPITVATGEKVSAFLLIDGTFVPLAQAISNR